MKRIDWIDFLKGVAIIAVVMHHTWLMVIKPEERGIFWQFALSFQMPLFMFLSGYVFTPHFTKLIKKCITFAMPILTVGVVYTLWLNRTLGELAYNDFKQGYWYLYVLGGFYALMSILNIEKHINKQWHIYFEVSFAIAVYTAFLLLQKTVPEPYNGMLSLGRCVDNFPYFFLGYMACKYHLIETVLAKHEIIFPLALSWWILCVTRLIRISLPFHISNIIMSTCAIIAFIYPASINMNKEYSISKAGNFFSWLGKHSIDIYIFHYFFVRSIHLEDFGKWIINTNNYLAETFIVFAISITIALLTIIIGKILRSNTITRDLVYGQFINKFIKQ